MENVLSEINVNHLQLKLSNQKLYIKTALTTETFALKTINEISVIDLIDEFNKSLAQHLKKRSSAFGIATTGIILFLVGIVLKVWLLSLCSVLPLIIGITQLNKLDDPALKSSLRLIMTNGYRDFEFNKLDHESSKIDEFIFNVKSTLRNIHR